MLPGAGARNGPETAKGLINSQSTGSFSVQVVEENVRQGHSHFGMSSTAKSHGQGLPCKMQQA